jgi:ATP-dependent Clp protease ATP-binding subunit ClpA
VFERFSEPARQAFVVAHEEARALGDGAVGTEHILLGLLADDGCIAGRAFVSLRVSPREVRRRMVLLTLHEGPSATPATTAELSDRAKRVLELALREALRLASPRIDTRHVALGMLGVRDSTAVRLLEELGVDPETGRTRVLETLSDTTEPMATPSSSHTSPSRSGVQLTPETRQLMRTAVRLGSTFAAGRFVSPGVMRAASATTRIVRHLGARAGQTTRLTPAVCTVCGVASPGCGTLYSDQSGALVCERCATGSGARDGS